MTTLPLVIGASIFGFIAVIDILDLARTSRRVNRFATESLIVKREQLCLPTTFTYHHQSTRIIFKTLSKKCVNARKLTFLGFDAPAPGRMYYFPVMFDMQQQKAGHNTLLLHDLLPWDGTQNLEEITLKLWWYRGMPGRERRIAIWNDMRYRYPQILFPKLKVLRVFFKLDWDERILTYLSTWKHVEQLHLRFRVESNFDNIPRIDDLPNIVELVLFNPCAEPAQAGEDAFFEFLKILPNSLQRLRINFGWPVGQSKHFYDDAEMILSNLFSHMHFNY